MTNKENLSVKEKRSFFDSFSRLAIWFVIIILMLWNWDGFWQTDIQFLNKAQKAYFSSKYTEEQLKVATINKNNYLISSFEEKTDKALQERKTALDELKDLKAELNGYLESENKKCRYYDTSLRMIDVLSKKYSEDEIRRVLNCTNVECEKILHNRQEAVEICN